MGGARYSGQLTLSEGINYVDAFAVDYNDNDVEGHTSFTLQPPPPHAVVHADRFRDVNRCVMSCFSALASYSTPAYVSADAPRAFTLLYRSERAKPYGLVEIDAVNSNPSSVQKYSIKLRRPDNSYVTFLNGGTEVYFTPASSNPTRLSVQFDATSVPTGAHSYTAIVTTHPIFGFPEEALVPTRVMIVNGTTSVYGAGWELALEQKATIQSDGVMIASGDGSVSFFEACSGVCQLTSPPGDFSTLNYDGGSYTRRYPDGTTYTFTTTGELSSIMDRLGKGFNFTRSNGRITIVSDPASQGSIFTYDGNGRIATIQTASTSSLRTSTFTVDINGDLTQVTDPGSGVALAATYTNHRLSTFTDRRGSQWTYSYWLDGTLQSVTSPSLGSIGQAVTEYSGPWRSMLVSVAVTGGPSWLPISASHDRRAYVKNPREYATYYTTNRWGSPTLTEFPAGPSATAQYNSVGQLTQSVSATGHTINY